MRHLCHRDGQNPAEKTTCESMVLAGIGTSVAASRYRKFIFLIAMGLTLEKLFNFRHRILLLSNVL
jgi:hypothetical protein